MKVTDITLRNMRLIITGWEVRALEAKSKRVKRPCRYPQYPKNRSGMFQRPEPEIYLRRIFERLKESDNSNCIEWTGTRGADGYGRIRIANKDWQAHRLIFVLYNGLIPDDLDVCHTCDNPPCCTLDHLFLGTRLDNMRDASRKGRLKGRRVLVGEEAWHTKLTESDVRQIRSINDAIGLKAISAQFGITPRHVWNIRNKLAWKHVP